MTCIGCPHLKEDMVVTPEGPVMVLHCDQGDNPLSCVRADRAKDSEQALDEAGTWRRDYT